MVFFPTIYRHLHTKLLVLVVKILVQKNLRTTQLSTGVTTSFQSMTSKRTLNTSSKNHLHHYTFAAQHAYLGQDTSVTQIEQ